MAAGFPQARDSEEARVSLGSSLGSQTPPFPTGHIEQSYSTRNAPTRGKSQEAFIMVGGHRI